MGVQRLQDLRIGYGDALLLVDVQNDFMPGGSLPVPMGDEVVPPLNRAIELFAAWWLPVVAARDWHPPDHCSFRAQGGPWPAHCVQGSRGAAFAPDLAIPSTAVVISKAMRPDENPYSEFGGTDMEARLESLGVVRSFVGGLATEYCVAHTVGDALGRGFHVCLLVDAIRAIDPVDGDRAVAEMIRRGALPTIVGTRAWEYAPSP